MGAALELVEQYWTMIETGDFSRIEALSQADCECIMPGGMELRGPEEVQPLLAAYHRAFPDLHHTVVSSVEEGDKVAVELFVTGTHTGPMVTPMGELPATGNRLELASTDVITIRDGKVATWHAYYDPTSMMVAIGAIAAPVG